jgi:hypothetical protein
MKGRHWMLDPVVKLPTVVGYLWALAREVSGVGAVCRGK